MTKPRSIVSGILIVSFVSALAGCENWHDRRDYRGYGDRERTERYERDRDRDRDQNRDRDRDRDKERDRRDNDQNRRGD